MIRQRKHTKTDTTTQPNNNKPTTTTNNNIKTKHARSSIVHAGCLLFQLFVVVVVIVVSVCMTVCLYFMYNQLSNGSDQPWASIPHHYKPSNNNKLNITILQWGSMGDIKPLVVWGRELVKRGHSVVFVGRSRHQFLVNNTTMDWIVVEDNYIDQLAATLAIREADPDVVLNAFRSQIEETMDNMLDQYVDAVIQSNANVLVGNFVPMGYLSHDLVAQITGLPIVFVTHDPPAFPTAQRSQDITATVDGSWVDRGFFKNMFVAQALMFACSLSASSSINSARERHNLPYVLPFRHAPLSHIRSTPVLGSFSTVVWPDLPTDYSKHWISTGSWSEPASDDADPELKEFLMKSKQNNRKVLYFGLGSNKGHDETETANALIGALDILQWNAVVPRSTIDMRTDLPPNVFVVDYAPHSYVFPRVDVIVHHGGAGTAMQAAYAGKPTICTPVMLFQEYWGLQMNSLGIGVVLQRTNLTAESLAATIKQLDTPTYKEKAQEIGKQLQRENGVETASIQLEQWIAQLDERIQQSTQT